MGRWHYTGLGIFLALCLIPQLSSGNNDKDNGEHKVALHDMLNTCMDARFHKSRPGPEDSLHSLCAPWANRSCCTVDTSISVHYDKMYNFDWNHCSHVSALSDKCRRRFRQDLCFYECSPNVGPWLVKVEQKIRNQRFLDVPFCRSDCEAWFKDCIDDFTCTDNWGLNFKWVNGHNNCPPGSSCKTFGAIFNNATNFCETLWDRSWKVVDDTEHCMRLWFDPEQGNPNDAVAKWKAEEIITYQMSQLKETGESSAGIVSHNPMVITVVPLLISKLIIFYY